MTNFKSRPDLSDIQFKQMPESILNLSGDTRINKINGLILVDENNTDIPFILSGGTDGETLKYKDGAIRISPLTPDELPNLTENVKANVKVGGIWNQRLLLSGTSFTDFVKKLLITTYYPTYTASSFGFNTNLGSSNVEAGTNANVILTYTFNRGSINGLVVDGIWNASAFQNYRAGNIIECIIDGTSIGTGLSLTRNPRLIVNGVNTFTGSIQYDIGAQPLDSYGDPSDPDHDGLPDSPLSAGISSLTTTIIGRRKTFFGTSSPANSSAIIRGLTSTFSTTSFIINIPIGATNVVFAYKNTLNDVTSVKYIEGLNAEIKAAFVKLDDIMVEGAEGYVATGYKVYMYTPAAPFPATATYNVTI